MSWVTYDRTFCTEVCLNLECYRNKYIMSKKERAKPHSYSEFKDTKECDGYIEVPDVMSYYKCDGKF